MVPFKCMIGKTHILDTQVTLAPTPEHITTQIRIWPPWSSNSCPHPHITAAVKIVRCCLFIVTAGVKRGRLPYIFWKCISLTDWETITSGSSCEARMCWVRFGDFHKVCFCAKSYGVNIYITPLSIQMFATSYFMKFQQRKEKKLL